MINALFIARSEWARDVRLDRGKKLKKLASANYCIVTIS